MGFTPKICWSKEVERPLKGVKKGEWFISKDLLPRGGKGIPLNLFPRGENWYKPKLLMGWWGKR